MLNEYFDKVYAINLDSSTERLATLTEGCEALGIEFERVSAVSGEDPRTRMWKKKMTEGWNRNAKGLTLTTIGILEDALTKGYESIFILEDDARFVKNFNSLLEKTMRRLPEDWDFVLLNSNHQIPPKQVAPCLAKIERSICCQAYGINRKVMETYLKRLKKMSKPIDEHTADLHQ